MAQDNRTERLLRIVDIGLVTLAALLIIILIGAYVLIHSGDDLSPPFRDFWLGIILDIVPVLLAFITSYLLLRGVRNIRSEHEAEKLAQEIASQVRTKLNYRRSPIRLESRKEFEKPLDTFIGDAQHVDMLGLSLLGTITECMGTLKSMSADSIRFLMVKPGSCGATESWGSVEGMSPGLPDVSQDVETALTRLIPLIDSGQLTVKLTETAPSFSLTILDPDSDSGTVQVELYCYRISPTERPHFRLDPTDQPWYRFFIDQFDTLWENADDYPPQSPVNDEQAEKETSDSTVDADAAQVT